MQMTHDEIRHRYRWLKPENAVRILAQLNDCTQNDIRRIVGTEQHVTKQAVPIRARYDHDKMTEMYKQGKSDKEISLTVGCTASCISIWRKRAGLKSLYGPGGKKLG